MLRNIPSGRGSPSAPPAARKLFQHAISHPPALVSRQTDASYHGQILEISVDVRFGQDTSPHIIRDIVTCVFWHSSTGRCCLVLVNEIISCRTWQQELCDLIYFVQQVQDLLFTPTLYLYFNNQFLGNIATQLYVSPRYILTHVQISFTIARAKKFTLKFKLNLTANIRRR